MWRQKTGQDKIAYLKAWHYQQTGKYLLCVEEPIYEDGPSGRSR